MNWGMLRGEEGRRTEFRDLHAVLKELCRLFDG
jgi:hypothetical protein